MRFRRHRTQPNRNGWMKCCRHCWRNWKIWPHQQDSSLAKRLDRVLDRVFWYCLNRHLCTTNQHWHFNSSKRIIVSPHSGDVVWRQTVRHYRTAWKFRAERRETRHVGLPQADGHPSSGGAGSQNRCLDQGATKNQHVTSRVKERHIPKVVLYINL